MIASTNPQPHDIFLPGLESLRPGHLPFRLPLSLDSVAPSGPGTISRPVVTVSIVWVRLAVPVLGIISPLAAKATISFPARLAQTNTDFHANFLFGAQPGI